MHLMLEGLGKHLLPYICAVLKAIGQLACVDAYIAAMPRRSSALKRGLKKVEHGLQSLHTPSAMDMPGVLLQAAIALGNHNSAKLPIAVTKKMQRSIYYFFALQRHREQESRTEREIEGYRWKVVQFLWSLRAVFGPVCKSEFRCLSSTIRYRHIYIYISV